MCARRLAKLTAYGNKIPVTAHSNSKRKVITGVPELGWGIAPWAANTKVQFTGFGSVRTTNTNGFCANPKTF
jgi:hypothetical protein